MYLLRFWLVIQAWMLGFFSAVTIGLNITTAAVMETVFVLSTFAGRATDVLVV